MKTTLQRIKEYVDFKGFTIQRFEKEIGFSNGAFATQLKNNKTIGIDKLENILRSYPELNASWLLTGRGEMLLNEPLNVVSEPKTEYSVQNKRVPVLDPEVVGGVGGSAFSFEPKDVREYYSIPVFERRGVDFIISLTGHSMEPSFLHGDKLACKIIHEDSFIEWNKPHVVATRERGMILKRIRTCENENALLMVSENREYEPYEVLKTDITGIAVVIGLVRLE